MKWIRDFQLFLFDFDGLLVNTEHIHYQAYVNMLARRGYRVGWSFLQFCGWAHYSADALKNQIYAEFPDIEPNWEILYKEKKEIYLSLLVTWKVELMPGVETLLRALEKARASCAVVTHSPTEQTTLIASKHPILKAIPHWIAREDYSKPKPDPECYLRAIQLFGKVGDRIVGFEDSVRGLQALRQTPALPVLICPSHHPLLRVALEGNVLHFESFEETLKLALLQKVERDDLRSQPEGDRHRK